MNATIERMEEIVVMIDKVSAVPFIGYERLSSVGADTFRQAMAETIASTNDDIHMIEARDIVKTMEDSLIESEKNTLDDKPEGFQRMCAQIAIVKHFAGDE